MVATRSQTTLLIKQSLPVASTGRNRKLQCFVAFVLPQAPPVEHDAAAPNFTEATKQQFPFHVQGDNMSQ